MDFPIVRTTVTTAKLGGRLKVFISYSRVDEAFAEELKLGLEDKGYAVEIDKHSIRLGEDWKRRLTKLISGCDTVVFVLSPDSARSDICHWEVEEAHKQAKRILPVLFRGLDEAPRGQQPNGQPWASGPAKAPERLALINYPDFADGRAFMSGLRGLVQALEDDLDWIEEHSRLASRANDWADGGRPNNRLMSGADIAAAKRLIEARRPTAPEVLPVQLDFIQASEAHDSAQRSEREKDIEERRLLAEEALARSQELVRRTRIGVFAVTILAVVAAGLGGWAENSRRTAEVAKTGADQALAVAEKRAHRLKLSMFEAMMEPTAVKEAVDFILTSEVGSEENYSKKYKRPVWPGGQSGVTIGVGYDIGYHSTTEFETDWGSALSPETISRLKKAVRVTGRAAETLVPTLSDIEVPFPTAQQLFFATTVPKYYNRMIRTFPGASELPFACQTALLSLVYNRGSSLEGDRRVEMRAIRDAIASSKVEDIAAQLRAMKRIWADANLPGLIERREVEALTCERAFRLREKLLPVLARHKQ